MSAPTRRHVPRLKSAMTTHCTICDRTVGVAWRNGLLKLTRHQRWPEPGICALSGTVVKEADVTGITPKPTRRL